MPFHSIALSKSYDKYYDGTGNAPIPHLRKLSLFLRFGKHNVIAQIAHFCVFCSSFSGPSLYAQHTKKEKLLTLEGRGWYEIVWSYIIEFTNIMTVF